MPKTKGGASNPKPVGTGKPLPTGSGNSNPQPK